MDFLPIFIDIKGKLCLVVGGGEVAARKASLLLKAGGHVRVVSPDLCPSLKSELDRGLIEQEAREYAVDDLNDCHLVIASTDNPAINRQIYEQASRLRIPVNVVDQPELCTFIVPSIIDRSPVVAAVSTGGASPILARLIRTRLETLIPAGYGHLAALALRFRDSVKERFDKPSDRRRFWEKVLEGGVAERVFAGHMREAETAMEQALAESGQTQSAETGPQYP